MLKGRIPLSLFERRPTRTAQILHNLHKLGLFLCALWTPSFAKKVKNFLLCALSCSAHLLFFLCAPIRIQYFNWVMCAKCKHNPNIETYNEMYSFLRERVEWEKRTKRKALEPCALVGVQKGWVECGLKHKGTRALWLLHPYYIFSI